MTIRDSDEVDQRNSLSFGTAHRRRAEIHFKSDSQSEKVSRVWKNTSYPAYFVPFFAYY